MAPVRPAKVKPDVLPVVNFVDVTKESGIHFVHYNGAAGEKLLPETMGAGVAFLDYDLDGDPDLFFVNSSAWPGHEGPNPAPTQALSAMTARATSKTSRRRPGWTRRSMARVSPSAITTTTATPIST